jgi:hypothetical protein
MARLSAKAILVGAVVDTGTTLVVSVVAGFALAGLAGAEGAAFESPAILLLLMALGMGATLLGGFVAGRIAGASHALHGGIVGAIGLVVSHLLGYDGVPLWAVILGDVLVIPAGVLGALLAKWGAVTPVSAGPASALPPPIERAPEGPSFSAATIPPTGATEAAPMFVTPREPMGLGGWLVLLAIGLFATPLRIAFLLISTHVPIYTDGTWNVLTDPQSEAYHPLWGPLIVFESVVNVLLAAAAIVAIVLFFKKSPAFPKVAIGVLLGNLAFVVVDTLVARAIPAIAEQSGPDAYQDLFRGVIACAIWVPYLLRSRRVRNTFVRPPEPVNTAALPIG